MLNSTNIRTKARHKMSAFGKKLKELRQAAKLSQRELAKRIRKDFTYLSKIETGDMPPPSEETIRAIAMELNADADELIILSKKIPSDLAEHIIEQPQAAALLRSTRGKVYTKDEWVRLIKLANETGKKK